MRVGNLNNFREFMRAPIFIGNDTSELQKEIDANSWAINITTNDQRKVKESDFQVLFRRIYAHRLYCLDNSGCSHGIVFYLWFDERVCQLRFSFISDIHKECPFKTEVNNVSFAEVIYQCRVSKCVGAISINGSSTEKGSLMHTGEDNPPEKFSINVYVRHFKPFVK